MMDVYFLYDCNIEGQQYFTANVKQCTTSFLVFPLKIITFLRLFIFKERAFMQLLFCWMLIGSNKFEPTKHIQTDSTALKRTQKKPKLYRPQKNLPKIEETSEPNFNQPEGSISVYGSFTGVLNSLGVLR